MATGRPRRDVIDETRVGVYHVWNRCVRKLFVFGRDQQSGRDNSARKRWLRDRLMELASIYAVDACSWAMLSNHYHLLVRNRPDLVAQWSDREVAIRWWHLYPERRDQDGRPATPHEVEIRSIVETPGRIEELRKRLSSISWFMKSLDEHLARRANAADRHKGHLWQDRYGCRRLLSEGAILVCSIYIDLNELRAKLAETLREAKHTSACYRLLAQVLRQQRAAAAAESAGRPRMELDYQFDDPDFWFCPLNTDDRSPLLGVPGTAAAGQEWDPDEILQHDAASVTKSWRHGFLRMTVDQYVELLERTIEGLASEQREPLQKLLAPLLEPLGVSCESWFAMIENFEELFRVAVGSADRLLEWAAQTGRAWVSGLNRCRACFE